MNPHTSVLKNIKNQLKEHHYIFIILIFIQIAFLIALSVLSYNYTLSLAEDFEVINVALADTMIENPYAVYQSITNLIGIPIALFVWFFVVYVLINGLNWELSHYIIHKRTKIREYIPGFAILTLIFTIPLVILEKLFVTLTLKTMSIIPFTIFPILIIVDFYFMYISFAVLKQRNIKETLKTTFKLGIKNAKTLIPTYLILTLIPVLAFLLFYYTLEIGLLVNFLTLTLFATSFVAIRMYFLNLIKELVNKQNK